LPAIRRFGTDSMNKKFFKMLYSKSYIVLKNGIWRNNQIFSASLGICSALAITNKVENAIAMGLGVIFVVMASSASTSLLRRFIPMRVRMITYMVLISTFVIVVQQFMKAFVPDISKALGPYVSLIITNCIVMGRAEAFAFKNSVKLSLLDAFSNGLGYTFGLIFVSIFREILAFGTILGINVTSGSWTNWVVMAMAPGGFFLLALYLWIMKSLAKVGEESMEGGA
jgi:Na+-transporting NADH:ubiquinone oxidoreductase subunit D